MEQSRGSGQKSPVSEEIVSYFEKKKQKKKMSIEDIVREVRRLGTELPQKKTIVNFFDNKRLPKSFESFMTLCSILDVEEKMVEKWGKTEPAFLFSYLNEVRPDAPDIKYLGVMIRVKNEKYSLSEIAEKTGILASSISRLEYKTSNISYDTFVRLCEFYGEKPLDVLNQYAAYPEYIKATENIPKYIYNGMELSGVTRAEAPAELGFSKDKFEKLLMGRGRFFVEDIRTLSVRFGLSAETLYGLAYKAHLNGVSNDFKEATKSGRIPLGERKVTDLTDIILRYKKVSDDKNVVETHTLLVLIYMILLSKNTDDYKEEIKYYLEHLKDKGLLYKDFIEMRPSWEALDSVELFNEIRNQKKCLSTTLSKEIGYSSAHIMNICNKKVPFLPIAVDKICREVGVSPVILLEGYMDSSNAERDTASIWDVIATVQATIVWNMEGTTVRTNTLSYVFRTIFNEKLNASQKYKEIKSLKYD